MTSSYRSTLKLHANFIAFKHTLAHIDGIHLKAVSQIRVIVFVIYRDQELAPQEYEKGNLILVPEDDYQAYGLQVPAYQDPNQIGTI